MSFCVGDGTNAQSDREGDNQEGLNSHGMKSQCLGVLPPRLLQGHSPLGEHHYTALVRTSQSSSDLLVNSSEHSA